MRHLPALRSEGVVFWVSESGRTDAPQAFLADAAPTQAVEVLTNGEFGSGLRGWTSDTSVNGTIALSTKLPGAPQVRTRCRDTFQCKRLRHFVGKINSFCGSNPAEGSCAMRTFTTSGGLPTFSADVAGF